MHGNLYQVDKEPIFSIPIFDTPDTSVKEQIIRLVDQIMTLYKELQMTKMPNRIGQIQSRISRIEDRLNALIYELYGLTNEDIKIIESD